MTSGMKPPCFEEMSDVRVTEGFDGVRLTKIPMRERQTKKEVRSFSQNCPYTFVRNMGLNNPGVIERTAEIKLQIVSWAGIHRSGPIHLLTS